LVFKQGEKGEKFYLVLYGKVSVKGPTEENIRLRVDIKKLMREGRDKAYSLKAEEKIVDEPHNNSPEVIRNAEHTAKKMLG
jgi:hypothetical protein